MADWGQIVLGKFIGLLFYMEGQLLDHGKGRGVSQMHFPVYNLKTLNVKIFANHEGICT